MNLYDAVADTPGGQRRLAAARLRREVLQSLYRALKIKDLSQADLARQLDVRKSAVNQVLRGDGNLRISTFAEYLHAMGYEAQVSIVPAGQPRQRVLEHRDAIARGWAKVYQMPSFDITSAPVDAELVTAKSQGAEYRTGSPHK